MESLSGGFGVWIFIHSRKRESLGTDAGRLVDSMMGKEESPHLNASPFLHEANSLAKGIGGGVVGSQVWKGRRWYEIAVLSKCLTYSTCKGFFSGNDAVWLFYPSAKRLESYQETASEDEDLADTPSGSLGNMAKPRVPNCRMVPNGPLRSKSSSHLAGSCSALASGEGSGETPHSRQAAFSSPIVSVNAWLASCPSIVNNAGISSLL